MKKKILLPLIVGAGLLLAGPLLSQAQARDHDRHRNHYYNSYSHGPGLGFVFDFSPRPAPVTVYRSPAPVYYSGNVVVDVQRALNRRGYDAGPVDGVMGGMTRAAIRDYQYDRGLAVTSRINESLLRSLGL